MEINNYPKLSKLRKVEKMIGREYMLLNYYKKFLKGIMKTNYTS